MPSGTWPTVVDHMESTRAAWKNSIGCGVTRRAVDISVRAHWYSFGARLVARASVVCRTAIEKQAHSSNGDRLASASKALGSPSGSNRTHRP